MKNVRLEDMIGKEAVITQTNGLIGGTDRQAGTIKGLGLRGIGSKVKTKITPEILGMIKKVVHLVKVEIL